MSSGDWKPSRICLKAGSKSALPIPRANAEQSLKSNPSNSCITTNGIKRLWIKLRSNTIGYVLEHGSLYTRCLATRLHVRGFGPSWPCAGAMLRQAIVVHHRGGKAAAILPEMVDDVLFGWGPGPYSTATTTKTGIAYNPGTDRLVANSHEMVPEKLVNKGFLCLPLNMDQ